MRRRTRSQWDEYYRDWHKKMKESNNDKGGRSVVDSESASANVVGNVAFVDSRVSRGRKKLDSDSNLECPGEEVVSNSSNLKTMSGSNASNQDNEPIVISDSSVESESNGSFYESDDLSESTDEDDEVDEDFYDEDSDDFSDEDSDGVHEPVEGDAINLKSHSSREVSDDFSDEDSDGVHEPVEGDAINLKGHSTCATGSNAGNNEPIVISDASVDSEDSDAESNGSLDEPDDLSESANEEDEEDDDEEDDDDDSDEDYDEARELVERDAVNVKVRRTRAKSEGVDEMKESKLGGEFTPSKAHKTRSVREKDNGGLDWDSDEDYNEVHEPVGGDAINMKGRCTRAKSEGTDEMKESKFSGEFAPSKGLKTKSVRDKDNSRLDWELPTVRKYSRKAAKTRGGINFNLTKILVESLSSLKQEHPIQENDLTQGTLPLRFRFEDEVEPPVQKSEWEEELDSLYLNLEMGLRESESDIPSVPVTENDDHESEEFDGSSAPVCSRGKHSCILDEQIGIICEYCNAILLDIKYVLPEFYIPSAGRRDRMYYDESLNSDKGDISFKDSAIGNPDSINSVKGTVWDLIPGVEKEMYPHQRQGFEFMWRNIAGDTRIEKLLKQPLPHEGRGCIISHAPGTGKTRLTIMFLLAFLKVYPNCRPVIIAPRGMLLTWESEFVKWNANVPFHNMNKNELSRDENAVAVRIMGQVGGGTLSRDNIRQLKLISWTKGRSILLMSYQLFENLAGGKGKGQTQEIRKVLLELPGLLVLDEGHTPRNNQSQLWNALMEVATHRRIILSGTPFQNNLAELHNTLCLVNPKFVDQIGSEYETGKSRGQKSEVARKRWMELTSSIGKNEDHRLMKLKTMLDPFIHVHKGSILEESLPGLSECIIFLHPTELQKTLLEIASEADIFIRTQLVSLITVHPSLMVNVERYAKQKSELQEIESDVEAGVKTKFVMQLIRLADALGERVLIFSQFIDPLVFVKKQILSRFSWYEGREVLYMDGRFNEKQRQESISSFNDDKSSAKVLLASERACSEGISLIGASRVVLLDTVWNPSVEKQAISRAYRLGQKRVVYVYRLFTSGTEVRQYALQVQKERISQLIVAPTDGNTCSHGRSAVVPEDRVLEAIRGLETFRHSFEKIIHQPKESDLIEIFGLMDQK